MLALHGSEDFQVDKNLIDRLLKYPLRERTEWKKKMERALKSQLDVKFTVQKQRQKLPCDNFA